MFYLKRVKRFGFMIILVGIVLFNGSESATAQTELIVNGSFETGNFSGWTTTQPAMPFRPWMVTGAGQGGGFPSVHTTQPQSGVFSAWNGFDAGSPVPAQFTLFQNITIPAMNSAQLTWKDRVSWNMRDFTGSTQPRLYQVQIRNPSTGAILQTIYSFTAAPGTAGDTGWLTHTANLSAYAGQTIRLFFLQNIPEPFTGPGQFEIDSISLIARLQSAAPFDFDGDRRADFAVFRPNNNFVYISRPDNSVFGFPFGFSGDQFTPGDYDGDGRTDIAVYRNNTGVFYVQRSSNNTVIGFQFGLPGDEPVARDYDGDGRTDFAVVRRTGGALIWYIQNSSNNTVTGTQFGLATDRVAPGDYDGDGRFDLAVFRGTGDQPATFFVQRSSGGFSAAQFGIGSDRVVPGDYDGDGRTDFAVVRPGTTFEWYILRSSNNTVQFDRLGGKSFLPVQNDYDGDGRTDVAVYDPNTNFFYFRRSSNGVLTQTKFGQPGDIPIAIYNTF
jgi:hypothetical protein